ncbi:MAG: potassium transporter TrkH [Eubacterium sp.]|nr:potassium transporter TrkH [Eubacterium sp.]
MRKFRLKSSQIIPLGFLGLILLGALLLMLPFSTASGESTDFSTALFTSTTSVCVTGSVVVDTYSYWSTFGQIVILGLIQLGGLGIVAVVSLVIVSGKRKKSLVGMMLLKDSFNLDSMRGVRVFIIQVFAGTLLVEFIGALIYLTIFVRDFGWGRGIWYSVFTAVSAFCNAGIDVIGPNSLMDYYDNYLVLVNTAGLIFFGGIGYVVWFELGYTDLIKRRRERRHGSREHTKVVLMVTAVLIAIGTVFTLILEWDNPGTIGNMSVSEKVCNSMFQSITYRTAGFTTFSQEAMHESTSLIGDILMFIGGSPVGTAGGVKTVTIFVVLANVWSFIRGRYDVVVFGRRIPDDLIRKASAIVVVNLVAALMLTIALVIAEGVPFTDALYEIMSGISTVGLSRGLTPKLHLAGRIILILTMYLGRIGPISMALFFKTGVDGMNRIRHAKGKFIIG